MNSTSSNNNTSKKIHFLKLNKCPRHSKVKQGLFTTPGVWQKPISSCLPCDWLPLDKKKTRQIKITKYIARFNNGKNKGQNHSQLESYDADIEMADELGVKTNNNKVNSKSRKSKSKGKRTPDSLDIEILSVLMDNLKTQPTRRYNLRKRKTKTKSNVSQAKQTKQNKCGKNKNKVKKSKEENYIDLDFTMMFEKIRI